MIRAKTCSGAGTAVGSLDIFRNLTDLRGDRQHGRQRWAEFPLKDKYALKG